MRAVVAVLAVGLLSSSFTHAAPPKKASAEAEPAKKSGRAKDAKKEGADGDVALESPYATEGDSSDEAGAPAPQPGPADTKGAPVSGDPELDAPPTGTGTTGDGPAPSPLNPEANEFPTGRPVPGPAELDALLSDIAALRGRVAALTTSLFSSKLRIYVRTDGDDARIDSLVVTLDEGVVFRAPSKFVAEDAKVIYEHAVAPGNHVLGVEVERHDSRGKVYRTFQSTRLSIVVPDKKLLEVDLRLEDDSDIAEDFPDDEDGEYDLEVRARARVTE